jgi:hypothetical protein
MKPTDFIEENSKVKSRFGEDVDIKWFSGIVAEINSRGEDEDGTFVSCAIVYEDGEIVEDTLFYDNDFETELPGSWKLDNENSKIVKAIYDNSIEIKELNSLIEDKLDNSIEDSEDDSEEDSDEEENPVKETTVSTSIVDTIESLSRILLIFTLCGFMTIVSIKAASTI